MRGKLLPPTQHTSGPFPPPLIFICPLCPAHHHFQTLATEAAYVDLILTRPRILLGFFLKAIKKTPFVGLLAGYGPADLKTCGVQNSSTFPAVTGKCSPLYSCLLACSFSFGHCLCTNVLHEEGNQSNLISLCRANIFVYPGSASHCPRRAIHTTPAVNTVPGVLGCSIHAWRSLEKFFLPHFNCVPTCRNFRLFTF